MDMNSENGDKQMALDPLDEHRMFVPDIDSFIPEHHGKWIWFSQDNHKLHRRNWENLKPLMPRIHFESSKSRGESRVGVIKCYTGENKEDILNTGLAFQRAIEADYMLYYKTNAATLENHFHAESVRNISEYMLTPSDKLYERDDLRRWKSVISDDGSTESSNPENLPDLSELCLDHEDLPSKERSKKFLKYHFRGASRYRYAKPTGKWQLKCRITDSDANGLTELDRSWLKVKALCKTGVFKEVLTQTFGHDESCKESPFRFVKCQVMDPEDVNNIRETGCKLVDCLNYPYIINFHRFENREIRKVLYQMTPDKELYVDRGKQNYLVP